VCVGEAVRGLGMCYLERYLLPFFFPCVFCSRPATELFEAYSMSGMTFNPPVASGTPRRKVPSYCSVSFFKHMIHHHNLCPLAHQAGQVDESCLFHRSALDGRGHGEKQDCSFKLCVENTYWPC